MQENQTLLDVVAEVQSSVCLRYVVIIVVTYLLTYLDSDSHGTRREWRQYGHRRSTVDMDGWMDNNSRSPASRDVSVRLIEGDGKAMVDDKG